jgi:acyl-CoA synthetase (NDP forming)
MPTPVKHFLEPESVAIIGASKTAGRPGYMIIENLLNWGYRGELFPVNPEGGEILGVKIYKGVEDLPEGIELALSLARAVDTPRIIEKCGDKKIKSIVVVSGGFSESGEEGSRLEEEIVRIAHEKGIRLMGPNAVGPLNALNNFISPFYAIKDLRKGVVSVVAQSGQFSCPVMEFMCSYLCIGINKSIDLGNRCDIDEADVVEYLDKDETTKVIGIYMESVNKGRKLVDIAKRTSRRKPIIVLKSGRTAFGAKAAASHTGAIAGDDEIADAAFKQGGMIRAWDLDEFIDLTKAFSFLPPMKGNRIGIITYSGGIGALAADACAELRLILAELSVRTVNKIKRNYSPTPTTISYKRVRE